MRRLRAHLGVLCGAAALVAVGLTGVGSSAGAATTSARYVAPTGSASAADSSCSSAAYRTIPAAVATAPAGGTVIVCPGVYKGLVIIAKPLDLIGRSATINAGRATARILGNVVASAITIGSSNVVVRGFTVEGAIGEGILAVNPFPKNGPVVAGMQLHTGTPISHVLIANNLVEHNDLGGPHSAYKECQASGAVPGDCGEGIHLMSVANSQVRNNVVRGNSGGILLTDEFGPNHGNTIVGNDVTGNLSDCGITLPSHNLAVNPKTHQFMPSFGGVYGNVVRNNMVTGNGLKGAGAGVLLAAPFSGAASYRNTIEGNIIVGNGQSGVTVHSHAPGAIVDGNVVMSNVIGENNLRGDRGPGYADGKTTAVLVWSAGAPIKITVTGNTIFDNTYGFWTNGAPSVAGVSANFFHGTVTRTFVG